MGGSSLSLLLLEDSAPDAQLLESWLREGGLTFEITRVVDRDAFTSALTGHTFDLVLSNYNVPGFDGLAALAISRNISPDTPFVFVTRALGEGRALELLRRGATDVVLEGQHDRLVPVVQRAIVEGRERSEYRSVQQRLADRERTYATLIANLPGMAFRCAPRDPWPFEFASEGCLALTGYRPEAFYAGGEITWSQIMHPDDVERVQRVSEAAFAEGRQLTVSYRIRTKQGEDRWVWDRSIAHRQQDGTLIVEGFVTDITPQRTAELEAKQRADFEQQLIGIVSHDLRNPLSVILLATERMLQRDELDEKLTKTIVRVQTAATRAHRMIHDLLDFTQARVGGGIPIQRKRIVLDEVIHHVLEDAALTHPDRELRVEHTERAEGDWDPDRIGQVVANLVQNAVRYGAPATPITVRVGLEPRHVILEVHNEGTPISPELRARLFQPLQRGGAAGDKTTRSIGLGLYIVDHIVRAHGGEIEIESSVDRGTTFRVRLPKATS